MAASTKAGTLCSKVLKMNNGLTIPQIGLGCYTITDRAAITTAFDAGYRHFDTANFYKNDKWVAEEIEARGSKGNNSLQRKDCFVSCKIPPNFTDAKKASRSVAMSVKSANVNGALDGYHNSESYMT
jgi:diketogulonate reductase-like aldo/keto reductase